MNLSLYSAAAGARAQQGKLDVISNNLANLHTSGYKTQLAGFVDLLYENYERGVTRDPDTGAGVRHEKTDFVFTPGSIQETGFEYDYAIVDEGFFAVYNPEDGEVYYTRNGAFRASNFGGGIFYLADQNNNLVLSKDMGLILINAGSEETLNIGIFDFAHKEGFLAQGDNYYLPVEKNGNPIVLDDQPKQGWLEMTNVDMAAEMTRVIETQRAYQIVLKMIQTTDEIEQNINSLRR